MAAAPEDMHDIQGTAADRPSVFAAQLGCSFQSGPAARHRTSPRITSLGKVIVEGGHSRIMDFVGDDPAIRGESDAVGQFDSAMARDWVDRVRKRFRNPSAVGRKQVAVAPITHSPPHDPAPPSNICASSFGCASRESWLV
jgi:hypothetical protein